MALTKVTRGVLSTGIDDQSNATAITIDSSENVGIGILSPASALHVDKSVANPAVIIHNTGGASSAYAGLEVETSTTGTYIQRWVNSGTEHARITGTGRLIIGGTTPSYKLQIEDAGETAAYFEGNDAGYVQGTIVSASDTSDTTGYRGQGMFYFNHGSDTTWYTGGVYTTADSWNVCRKSSTTSLDTSTAQFTNALFRINSSGNVTISGSLSKTSGSFKIDHPLESKRDTHHLVHSFVEAPQADNIYRGKIDLVNGSATVNIDTVAGMTEGTFVALNREVQCFTSNESDWDAVKGSVSGNILTISCENTSSTATVSWLVIGERQDQHMLDANTDWTDENGKVILEPEKQDEEEIDLTQENA